jgi:excisionase family DNA binding protein
VRLKKGMHLMTTLTVNEIAQKERISPDTVKRALHYGHLKGHQIGGRGLWRIDEADYRDWIARGAPTHKSKEPKP